MSCSAQLPATEQSIVQTPATQSPFGHIAAVQVSLLSPVDASVGRIDASLVTAWPSSQRVVPGLAQKPSARQTWPLAQSLGPVQLIVQSVSAGS